MSRFLSAVLIAAAMLVSAGIARSAELLMFEEKWCSWCQQWHAEVGPIYPKSAEGRRAPLRQVDIHRAYPEGIAFKSRPQFTPTFVLVHDGREIGRIEGYPGEDFFWGLLARIMKGLPAGAGEVGSDAGS